MKCTILNKIDLPSSDPDKIKNQIEEVLGIDASTAVMVSAKTGENRWTAWGNSR